MPNDLEQFAGGELKEWSLQPDKAVWDAVAERIRKERKRRIIFWWTAAAIFAVVMASTWIFMQGDDATEAAFVKQEPTPANKEVNQSSIKLDDKIGAPSVDRQKTNTQAQNSSTQQINSQTQSTVNLLAGKTRLLPQVSAKQPSISKNDKSILLQHEDENKTILDQNTANAKPAISVHTQDALADDIEIKTDSLSSIESKLVISSLDKHIDSVKATVADTVQQKTSNRKKLQWYFTMQVGISDIQPNKILGLATAQDMQFGGSASPVLGSGNISGIAISPGNLQYKAGYSFSLGAGIFLINKKQWQLSAGLHYRFASMDLITGAKVDTVFQARDNRINTVNSVTAFYRPGTGYTYQHQFHLLQMPVTLYVQPFASKKWRANLSLLPAVLLGAKALHYNEGSNVFYVSNQQYQRFLLNSSLGMQYAIPIKKGKKIWVGPQFELGLRNMHQSVLSRKAFFQSANISFTIQ